MGNIASQELLRKIQERRININEALNQPDIQQFIRQVGWPDLDQSAKDYISSLFPKRDRLKPLFDVNLIVIPQAHRSIIREWAHDTNTRIGLKTSPVEVYELLQELTQAKNRPRQEELAYVEDIKRRLQFCILYLIRCEWMKAHPPGSLNQFIGAHIAGRELNLVGDDIIRWSHSGENYHYLAQALGGYGSVLVLPPQIPRTLLEKHLTPKSSRFTEAIQHLADLDILRIAQETGAYEAAENILRSYDLLERSNALNEELPQE